MDEVYKNHAIDARAMQDPDTGRWTPKTKVSWSEGGEIRVVPLEGLAGRCRSMEEAESYALGMARKWIDDGKPDLKDGFPELLKR